MKVSRRKRYIYIILATSLYMSDLYYVTKD